MLEKIWYVTESNTIDISLENWLIFSNKYEIQTKITSFAINL